MRCAVIIAEGDERPDFKLALTRTREGTGRGVVIDRTYGVLDHGDVFTVHHEHRFLKFELGYGIGEHRKRLEPEVLQVLLALRMDHAGILVGRQLEALSIHDEGLFELGEEHETPHGWPGGGGEQTMIAPRVQTKNRRGRKTAESVRFQPLTL